MNFCFLLISLNFINLYISDCFSATWATLVSMLEQMLSTFLAHDGMVTRLTNDFFFIRHTNATYLAVIIFLLFISTKTISLLESINQAILDNCTLIKVYLCYWCISRISCIIWIIIYTLELKWINFYSDYQWPVNHIVLLEDDITKMKFVLVNFLGRNC